MTRSLLAVLLLPLLAPAAPVPKLTPTMADVFGKIADEKDGCKYEMGKSGALTITVPTTHPTFEPGKQSARSPLVAKSISGDFTVTLRVSSQLPKTASLVGKAEKPAILAGLAIEYTDAPGVRVTTGVIQEFDKDEWSGHPFVSQKDGGSRYLQHNLKVLSADATWVRVSRTGEKFLTETSGDGKSWQEFDKLEIHAGKLLGDSVTVGPVAFGCIDKEFTATFDEYKIELLKDEKK